MAKIQYETKKFREATLDIINVANDIIEEYAAQGYDLTLRQLYYQFVSRDLIPNKQSEYKRLGGIISDGRRAGLIDWDAIVDRTRNLSKPSSWDSPCDIIKTVAKTFKYDLWETQPNYVEVWFEKDALMGVFERATSTYRIPFFSCRGYTSDSEMWSAAERFRDVRYERKGMKKCYILHFGDHDPSGIDMSRDIQDRLTLFEAGFVKVKRIALTMQQIKHYNPPPNPAKDTDARFADYQAQFGDQSWELDALDPTIIGSLISREMKALIDLTQWDADKQREKDARKVLAGLVDSPELEGW